MPSRQGHAADWDDVWLIMIYTFTGAINRAGTVNPVHDRSRLRACMTLGRDPVGWQRGVFHMKFRLKKPVSRQRYVGYRDDINGVWRNRVS